MNTLHVDHVGSRAGLEVAHRKTGEITTRGILAFATVYSGGADEHAPRRGHRDWWLEYFDHAHGWLTCARCDQPESVPAAMRLVAAIGRDMYRVVVRNPAGAYLPIDDDVTGSNKPVRPAPTPTAKTKDAKTLALALLGRV